MTTIAWDGKTLAADRMATYGHTYNETTKIWRLADGSLLGGAGETASILQTKRWIEDRIAATMSKPYPECQKDKDDWAAMMRITKEGVVEIYEKGPIPGIWEGKIAAIGSGRSFALMAMHLGLCARQAVIETSVLAPADSNYGVDMLELHPLDLIS